MPRGFSQLTERSDDSKLNEEVLNKAHDGQNGAAAVDGVVGELERRRDFIGLASDESDRRHRNSDRIDPME